MAIPKLIIPIYIIYNQCIKCYCKVRLTRKINLSEFMYF